VGWTPDRLKGVEGAAQYYGDARVLKRQPVALCELPRPIVDGLNKALATALTAGAVKKLLDAQHTIVAASTPEQMRAAIAEESAEARTLITSGRERVENN